MGWSTTLCEAAEQFDGGARSFPFASELSIVDKYGYDPPNEDYAKLFSCQATVRSSKRSSHHRPHSAGWLVPTEDIDSVCKPVFVAHSLLSAIWLLHESLPEGALSDEAWNCLVCAAQSLAEGTGEAPPSAQKPSASSADRRKRPTPSLCVLSPKRARTEPAETPLSSPQQSEHGEQFAQRTTSITNNNRRAEQARTRKLDDARRKNRLSLGLREPGSEASSAERAAYASISRQDEALVAWIIKQPVAEHADFYSTAQAPYAKACELLEKARALGNPSSRHHAAQFLQTWRERGSPFGGGVAVRHDVLGYSQRGRDVPPVQSTYPRTTDGEFCLAWDRCRRYAGVLAAVNIEYRWAEALLGKAYADKILQIQEGDQASSSSRSRSRNGKGQVRTEAIAALLALVNPHPTPKDREAFRKRLTVATRWYRVAEGLGWGTLMLMPHDKIASSWIESTVRAWGLDAWIELVKKIRPDVCAASKALENWLGPEGIAGCPIGEKEMLGIEADAPTASCAIEEILDSEDDDNSVVELSQAHASPVSSIADAPLRQMTLLELFHPVDEV